jgi:4'-phosphopantetheinyl transferase
LRIDLWLVDLDAPAGFDELPALLSGDERIRARRFARERDRRRFARARGHLRSVLGSYLSIPGERVAFRYTETGKPELEARCGLEFSVSHSRHLLLIGVAMGPIGVDVECVRPMPDLDAVAAQAFTEREMDGLGRDFFRLWTAKESVLKGLGRGFSTDPRAVELRPAPGGFHAPRGKGMEAAWSVRSFAVAGGRARAAVAVPGEGGIAG